MVKTKGMTKKDRERPFDLQWIRRKRKKTKKEIRRLKKFDERKRKIPPFDSKCKECGKPIPSPLDFCSSKCSEEYYKKHDKKIPSDIEIRKMLKEILKK